MSTVETQKSYTEPCRDRLEVADAVLATRQELREQRGIEFHKDLPLMAQRFVEAAFINKHAQ